MKEIRYLLEAAFVYPLFWFFKMLPVDGASACGGWLGRTIGPRLAASRKALRNLRLALPGRSDEEYARILAGMWDNLGRLMAEYPHLEKICRERVEVLNADSVRGKPCVIFGGHLGNWEICLMGPYFKGITCDAIYRAPNNPWTGRLLGKARSPQNQFRLIPKSRGGSREFLKTLEEGRPLLLLIDQKYNEGIPVPFFGHDAKTSTAFVKIPQRSGCPAFPMRMERLQGANFRLTFYEPLQVNDETGAPLPVEQAVANAHRLLESWIAEKPEQWLWLHRRWPKDAHSS